MFETLVEMSGGIDAASRNIRLTALHRVFRNKALEMLTQNGFSITEAEAARKAICKRLGRDIAFHEKLYKNFRAGKLESTFSQVVVDHEWQLICDLFLSSITLLGDQVSVSPG